MLSRRRQPEATPRRPGRDPVAGTPGPVRHVPAVPRSVPGLAWGLGLVVLSLAAYSPALSAGFIWDDDAYVTENPNLRSADGLRRIWVEPTASPQYYPLVFTSFWVEYHAWGLTPAGYHLTNVLLHGLNGVILWLVLGRLRIPAAWLAAAAFVVHPVHVESVAWVTERKNILSGLFYLAAALACFRFAPPDPESARPAHRWRWYALALSLFVCALLSKTVTSTLPAAIGLVLWWKRGRLTWRDILPLAPFLVLGAGLGLVTAWLEKNHVGAAGPEWAFSPADRVLIAGRAFWFYLGKLIWPADLTFIYPRWEIDDGAAWQYLFPAAAVGLVIAAWSVRRRAGADPLVATLFFAGTLVPALGFVNVYPMRFSFVADHFQYLASIGPIALFAAAGSAAMDRWSAAPWARTAVGAVILLVLAGLTVDRAGVYANAETIWRDTVARNPGSAMAHNNLGEALIDAGRLPEAEDHYREAVRLRPADPSFHYSLGKAYWLKGDAGSAVGEFRTAVELQPGYVAAQYNLGLALRRKGDTVEAVNHLEEAVRLKPDFVAARNTLGVIYATQGKIDEATVHFLAAADANPDDPEPLFNLALTYARLDRLSEALEYADRAFARRPADERIWQLRAMLREQVRRR